MKVLLLLAAFSLFSATNSQALDASAGSGQTKTLNLSSEFNDDQSVQKGIGSHPTKTGELSDGHRTPSDDKVPSSVIEQPEADIESNQSRGI